MKTVKELKEELAKFPDDAKCVAYEGEATGVRIDDHRGTEIGFIHLNEYGREWDTPDRETEIHSGNAATNL